MSWDAWLAIGFWSLLWFCLGWMARVGIALYDRDKRL